MPQCSLPGPLDPLSLTITTIFDQSPASIPDPDIEIPTASEEETFEQVPSQQDDEMAICSMEIKAGLPEDFLGKNEDATWWLLSMKVYFTMNLDIYTDKKTRTLILLNKMNKGGGATFVEGWYLKLMDESIPDTKKALERLCTEFEEAFVLKDL